ncbi:MAG TPA: DNA-binding response regulator [Lachnospiraceae bacterium]|nr:DNA-binding response regulator [Lachnospiraceae bacterium]
MIYIAICDDNEKAAESLTKKVTAYFKKNNICMEIAAYSQSRMLQYDIQEGKYFDIILSDIDMPYINGMDLARYIKSHLPDVFIIFVTSYLKYAIDAYELAVFRYIPKNAIDERLRHALEDVVKLIEGRSDRYYHITMPSRVEKIPYQRILYIWREGKNTVISLTDNTETRVRKSLAQVMGELNCKDFIYIDRGNIANLRYILRVKDGIVEMENGIRLPASHAKEEQIKQTLSKFWGEQI